MQGDISPVKVMEYMACGLPFVAFDVQETRVMGQDASALVAPADTESYAREIVTLLDDHASRAKMGEVGRKRVRRIRLGTAVGRLSGSDSEPLPAEPRGKTPPPWAAEAWPPLMSVG